MFNKVPKYADNTHTKMDIKIYIKEVKYFFEVIRSTISYENAEKVVKDPKRPIIRKNLIKFSDNLYDRSDVIKYPIKKEPIIFTEIVP